ncbi:MAG: HAD-IIB family hydrolase [Oligoflexia bacterium]|nr:HAD-IIB family hydrolase [Oligoflexia bacterium]MBF0366559.1 HAD-IIB family hydrolase [Oligoflexia bacterium]
MSPSHKQHPLPLDKLKIDTQNFHGLLFDIDDTFTSDGKITADAFASLWKLYNSGVKVIAVTGRPAGWCDHIARMWPVSGVIGENGALFFRMLEGKLNKLHLVECDQVLRKKQMAEVWQQVSNEIPRAKLASDQNYREFDLAIDFCEDVKPSLTTKEIDRIVQIFEAHHACAKISSIHINGWWGVYDKLTSTKEVFKRLYSVDLEKAEENKKYIFCGDSPNDAPMFQFFYHSIGVRNVERFLPRLPHPPRYIASKESGEGFTEIIHTLLESFFN